MKIIYTLLVCMLFTLSISSQNKEIEFPFGAPESEPSRGVFGQDDRMEVKDAEGYEDFARATAAMIHKDNIYNKDFYSWSLKEKIQNKYGKDVKIEEGTKFLDQPALASCTGFLIAPDILVTAGHCIKTMEDAKKFVWVFDYTNEKEFINNRTLQFKDENIFEVKAIIAAVLDDNDDYAVLQLSRKSDRKPYRFRTSGSVLLNGAINTIGSPKGLPLKFSTNATVIDVTPSRWFKSDLDSFPGNSGGPVFDQNGFIEGILVRGAVKYDNDWSLTGDFYFDSACDCVRTVTWESVKYTAGCQAQRITTLPANALISAVYKNLEYAITNKLHDRFNTWHPYSWIYERDYTKNNGRLETTALNNNNLQALAAILKITSENISDDYARTLIDKAVSTNNNSALKLILEAGILADAGAQANYTALQNTIRSGKITLAKTLIYYGADVNITTNNKDNLLHLAAKTGSEELVKLLYEKGVRADVKNNSQKRPEQIAKKAGYKKLAKLLKKARKGRL